MSQNPWISVKVKVTWDYSWLNLDLGLGLGLERYGRFFRRPVKSTLLIVDHGLYLQFPVSLM